MNEEIIPCRFPKGKKGPNGERGRTGNPGANALEKSGASILYSNFTPEASIDLLWQDPLLISSTGSYPYRQYYWNHLDFVSNNYVITADTLKNNGDQLIINASFLHKHPNSCSWRLPIFTINGSPISAITWPYLNINDTTLKTAFKPEGSYLAKYKIVISRITFDKIIVTCDIRYRGLFNYLGVDVSDDIFISTTNPPDNTFSAEANNKIYSRLELGGLDLTTNNYTLEYIVGGETKRNNNLNAFYMMDLLIEKIEIY